MFKILLLILVVLNSFAFAQENENLTTSKFDEFESAIAGTIKLRMDAYQNELQKYPASQGYIINFGTSKEIAGREKQIRNSIALRRSDASRIVIVNGGFRGEIKTELWIVPQGAEPPEIETVSNKLDEFGPRAIGHMKVILDNFFTGLQNLPGKQGSVVITGAARDILKREKFIRDYISMRKFDASRIRFINNGFSKEINTELWIDL